LTGSAATIAIKAAHDRLAPDKSPGARPATRPAPRQSDIFPDILWANYDDTRYNGRLRFFSLSLIYKGFPE
jgi:hypothetical protein